MQAVRTWDLNTLIMAEVGRGHAGNGTMDRKRIYLDYNATAPLHPRALDAMRATLALTGNPSSIHAEGRNARAAIERARGDVARLLGATARAVVFTSGGTEAAVLALTPSLQVAGEVRPFDRLLVTATEHVCVLKGHRFPLDQVRVVPVTSSGELDRDALQTELGDGKRILLAVQLANNETGVIQDLQAISAQVHAHGGAVVCDAVQAAGRMAIDLPTSGADALFVSAHKLGGPKGTGALVFADERTHIRDVSMRGGGQEGGMRGGTENVAGIAGFGAACEAVGDIATEARRVRWLRDRLEDGIKAIAPDAVILGESVARLPNTSTFAVAGMPSETLLIALDLAGLAVSSGSACSSGKVARSHVLEAMGVSHLLAQCAIRLSLGWASTTADVEGFLAAFRKVASDMLARHRVAA